jgi:hypothetical protein
MSSRFGSDWLRNNERSIDPLVDKTPLLGAFHHSGASSSVYRMPPLVAVEPGVCIDTPDIDRTMSDVLMCFV